MMDVTMETVSQHTQQLSEIQTILAALQRGETPLPTMSSRNGVDRPKTQMAKPKYYSDLPGENFLAWRSQFQVIAEYNRWSQDEGKAMAFAYMSGQALESVMDIKLNDPLESVKDVLDKYQARFLPESRSQMLRAQFDHVVQLPNESIQKLHSRMRVLYQLAYPDLKDRSEINLIERFIKALNNREVQNHVRRRKPAKYSDALNVAQEETAFVLMDAVTHSPNGPQQPMPGDGSFIGAIRARAQATPAVRPAAATSDRKCYYCGEGGHLISRCPKRLKDFLQGRKAENAGRILRPSATAAVRNNPPTVDKKKPLSYDQRLTTTNQVGAKRIATLQEEDEDDNLPAVAASQDPLDDYDFACLDEATIAALYEAFKDTPIEGGNQGQDFL